MKRKEKQKSRLLYASLQYHKNNFIVTMTRAKQKTKNQAIECSTPSTQSQSAKGFWDQLGDTVGCKEDRGSWF